MKRTIIALSVLALLSGCAVTQKAGVEFKPQVAERKMQKEFDTISPPANGKKVSVAVYSFSDKTGQRKAVSTYASFSMAVTQGAEPFLIAALQDVEIGRAHV